jgi:hypothetical protein
VNNASVNYLLVSAFQYELTNQVDLVISRLSAIQNPTAETQQRLANLHIIRDYFISRQEEMKSR